MKETNLQLRREQINANFAKLDGLGKTKRVAWFAKRRYSSI